MTAKDADKPATGKPSWLARLAQRRWVTCLEVLLALPMLLSDLFACKSLRAPATTRNPRDYSGLGGLVSLADERKLG